MHEIYIQVENIIEFVDLFFKICLKVFMNISYTV